MRKGGFFGEALHLKSGSTPNRPLTHNDKIKIIKAWEAEYNIEDDCQCNRQCNCYPHDARDSKAEALSDTDMDIDTEDENETRPFTPPLPSIAKSAPLFIWDRLRAEAKFIDAKAVAHSKSITEVKLTHHVVNITDSELNELMDIATSTPFKK